MADIYSTYEAKARFSEVMRKVRAGKRVIIAYRGEQVAEIAPIAREKQPLGKVLQRLEDRGLISRRRSSSSGSRLLVRKPGALKRFLDSRE